MGLLNYVKKSLLIPVEETYADDELNTYIDACRALILSTGVKEEGINENPLTKSLVLIYCKTFFGFNQTVLLKNYREALICFYYNYLYQMVIHMFPSSPNIKLELLKLDTIRDYLGNNKLTLISKKSLIGMRRSVTSKEYYESKKHEYSVDLSLQIQSFLYDGSKYALVDGIIYSIERTYLAGQFIELYLVETKMKVDDINGYT